MLEYVDLAVKILSAALTPLIAVIAIYIAWQQLKTNREKLNLERYERRLRIYEETKKIIMIICREADVSYEDLTAFKIATSEADFLFGFGSEIPKYLDEIFERGINLKRWNNRDNTMTKPADYDHTKVLEEMHKEELWLTSQFEPAKERFKKYLKIS